jgi:RNA polymerase sigma-70 factor (ECF subfamily)
MNKTTNASERDTALPDLSNRRVLSPTTSLAQDSPLDPATAVLLAQKGNAEAFGELCCWFENRLLRQAIIFSGDISTAEDLVQDTLLEAWKSLHRYNGRCQFFTWLCAIMHNRYHHLRRRHRFLIFLGFEKSVPDGTLPLLEQRPGKDLTPDQAVQAREQADLVRKCVHTLSRKHQQVIYLRFFVDDSLEGIALALGCSLGTVKSRLFHALHKLRTMPPLRAEHRGTNENSSLL